MNFIDKPAPQVPSKIQERLGTVAAWALSAGFAFPALYLCTHSFITEQTATVKADLYTSQAAEAFYRIDQLPISADDNFSQNYAILSATLAEQTRTFLKLPQEGSGETIEALYSNGRWRWKMSFPIENEDACNAISAEYKKRVATQQDKHPEWTDSFGTLAECSPIGPSSKGKAIITSAPLLPSASQHKQ